MPISRRQALAAAAALAAPRMAWAGPSSPKTLTPALAHLADQVDLRAPRLASEPLDAIADIHALLRTAVEDGTFDAWSGVRTAELDKIGLTGRGPLLGSRWKLQLFFIPAGASHPPHCHETLTSCMVVVDGRLKVREFHRSRVDDGEDAVALRRAGEGEFGPGEGMVTTENHRNAHWFGTLDAPAVALNFKAVGYERHELLRLRTRRYVDPTVSAGAGDFMAPVIGRDEAHHRFGGRLV